MEYRILGPLEVLDRGRSVDLGAHKQRALLALLLLHVGRVVSTDRILDDLWGDEAVGKEKALWVHVSRLRSALEPHRTERGAQQRVAHAWPRLPHRRRSGVGRRVAFPSRSRRGPDQAP